MASIIEFPTKAVRDWAIIERTTIDELKQLRVSPTVENRVIEQMKKTYDLLDDFSFSAPIEFPGSIPADQIAILCAGISDKISEAIKEHLHALANRILIDRLNREMQVCQELGLI
jgi:hypothetical protein